MALEVLGVVVDQIEKISPQFAKGSFGAETGHDGQQPGAATGKDPQCLDRFRCSALSGYCVPQSRTVVRVQGLQVQHTEQVIESAFAIIDLVEPTGCAGQKEKARLGLEHFT